MAKTFFDPKHFARKAGEDSKFPEWRLLMNRIMFLFLTVSFIVFIMAAC